MVIPAEAGIQSFQGLLGSRSLLKTCRDKLRGSDGSMEFFRSLLDKLSTGLASSYTPATIDGWMESVQKRRNLKFCWLEMIDIS
jgi:hypothetical protein